LFEHALKALSRVMFDKAICFKRLCQVMWIGSQ